MPPGNKLYHTGHTGTPDLRTRRESSDVSADQRPGQKPSHKSHSCKVCCHHGDAHVSVACSGPGILGRKRNKGTVFLQYGSSDGPGINRGFDFLGVRLIFISLNEPQKLYFHKLRSHK